MSVLCVVIILLPTASWLPAGLMVQFRLGSEEEVETVGETLGETAQVRRKPLKPQKRILQTFSRTISRALPVGNPSTLARGEYRFLNGTGAALRC